MFEKWFCMLFFLSLSTITLWKKGYDVWLTNHRGTPHSKNHINLTTSDPEYWNFSFHEIALYDFPAQLELIANKTNNAKTIFLGYSMAGTEALIYSAMKPQECQKFISNFILIAPTTILKHLRSPFRYLLAAFHATEKYISNGEFWRFEPIRWLMANLTISPFIVDMFSSIVMGSTPGELDPVLYPFIYTYHGKGLPNKMLAHYSQIYSNEDHFQFYDYGDETNLQLYGSATPPDYPLKQIPNPVYIIHGNKDSVATPADVEILCNELLPNNKLKGKVLIHNNNHIDYMFSKYRMQKTYESVYQILEKICEI